MLVADDGSRGLRVAHCSPEAWRQGVRPGWPLAEARALLSPRRRSRQPVKTAAWLHSRLDADRRALQQLAQSAQEFSPYVGLEVGPTPESLLLDVTGCAHLWGGEPELLTAVERYFRERGYQSRLALAETVGAAWAVAHVADEHRIIGPAETEACLRPLPVAALRIDRKISEQLHHFGLHTIGEVLDLPRNSLTARFGRELPLRIEQALGQISELIEAERFAEPWVEALLGEDTIDDQSSLALLFRELLGKVLERLQGQRVGLLEWRCVFPLGSQDMTWEFRLSRPATELPHLATLFQLRCERDGLPTGSYGLRLEVVRVGLLSERQTSLFETDESQAREWSSLLDRLSQRLGDDALLQPVFRPDPLPEMACTWESSLQAATAQPTDRDKYQLPSLLGRCRPSRLLKTPQPLQVISSIPDGPPRRVFHREQAVDIQHYWGPERIESGWWRRKDIKRDYYRIELESGHHWWIFRDRTSECWFVQGFFE